MSNTSNKAIHCAPAYVLEPLPLNAMNHLLIDVRATESYSGEVEPQDRTAGHIPGALNLPLQKNLDDEGNFLSPAQLRNRLQQALGDARLISHTAPLDVVQANSACHPAQEYRGGRECEQEGAGRGRW